MEELLVYAILLYEELATETDYNKRLDELFLNNPENDDFLYLEWEGKKKHKKSYYLYKDTY